MDAGDWTAGYLAALHDAGFAAFMRRREEEREADQQHAYPNLRAGAATLVRADRSPPLNPGDSWTVKVPNGNTFLGVSRSTFANRVMTHWLILDSNNVQEFEKEFFAVLPNECFPIRFNGKAVAPAGSVPVGDGIMHVFRVL